MNLSPTINCANTSESYGYARLIVDELRAAHLATPFATADDVSSWLHRTYGNPRLKVETDDAGTTIRITYNGDPFITIGCN